MNQKTLDYWRAFPHTFAQYCSDGDWKPYPHLEYISLKIGPAIIKGGARFILEAPPRHGKALAVDTPIPTPKGWVAIGSLRAGDFVFDENGAPTKVVAVSPVWKDRKCYKVSTRNSSIVADAEHEWLVRLCRKAQVFKKKTTEYLANRSSPRGPLVEHAGPIQYGEKNFTIKPYLLGVWLGDGTSKNFTISSTGEKLRWIRSRIDNLGVKTSDRAGNQSFGVIGLIRDLRAYGLSPRKFIPQIFLEGSIEQRLELLRGLVDTDGHVTKGGQVEITTIHKGLSDNILELVRSLGVKASMSEGDATIYGRFISRKYRVTFYMEGCATLPHKARKTRNAERSTGHYLRFEKVKNQDTVCIEVESPSHLFLAGPEMIPTCNSELCSHWLPIWFLDMFPGKRVILASYNAQLATDFGRQIRNTIESNKYVTTAVSGDSSAAHRFSTLTQNPSKRGGFLAAGVNGTMTGKGADLLIIDDPVKGWEDAKSVRHQERTIDWYNSVARTRLEPGASIVIMQTRWHESDLAGKLTGPSFTKITMPAIAEENDILGRKEGEPLCTERFSLEALQEIKREVGGLVWSALFQQDPSPQTGSIIKSEWWKFYKVAPKFDRVIQFWDCAHKAGVDNDYSVCATWGENDTGFYLLDVWRQKVEAPDLERAAITLYNRDKPHSIVIEDKASGIGLIQSLRRKRLPVLAYKTGSRDKVTRALNASPQIEAGNCYLPEDKPFVADFLLEHQKFPNGKHDDQVDTTSMAIETFTSKSKPMIRARLI